MAAVSGERLRKYSLYALGEILLVVVGILIALQVNDWNETRKADDRVKGVLASLVNEMSVNRAAIAEAQPRRKEFLDWLQALTESLSEEDKRQFLFDVPAEERFAKWPGSFPLRLDSAMFDAAKYGGVLAGLKPELLEALSQAYSRQAAINGVGEVLTGKLFDLDYETRHGDLIRLFWRLQEEFFGGQYLLVRDYEKASDLIERYLRR